MSPARAGRDQRDHALEHCGRFARAGAGFDQQIRSSALQCARGPLGRAESLL
jgi:hypothetical protein